jgi:hypothetical protein
MALLRHNTLSRNSFGSLLKNLLSFLFNSTRAFLFTFDLVIYYEGLDDTQLGEKSFSSIKE